MATLATTTVASTNLITPIFNPAFELVRSSVIPSLAIQVYEFKHIKTGAMHIHLATENDENVFMVAFRTQPMSSNGVAHVLEHTALCGSKRFPVRDPFFSMLRRSLNTFMNAFTAADWTAYPFATQNKTDFYNLLSIYLDATFFPNIHALDFAQEGIRVELEDDKPVFKGIVFNEMKGAMSAPTDQLYHQLAHHLYPNTTYHYNSGGDPAIIPTLTHQQLLDFHASHYHPSNAVFMTFGNHPVLDLQTEMQNQVLSQFSQGERRHSVPETRLTTPLNVTANYAVDEDDLSKKTHILMAWLLPESTDIEMRLAFRLLEGYLLEHSASPLRHYLETCGLGESPSPILGLDDSNFEMTLYCGIQGSEPEQAAKFEQGVLDLLEKLASQPIPATDVEAILHQIELHQREITGDGMPYGLNLLLKGLGSAIHGGDVQAVLDMQPHLVDLRAKAQDANWLPQLIREYLLDNKHRVCLTLQPDAQQSAQLQAAEQAKLDAIAATLDDKKRAELKAQAQALTERQATKDDLSLLPKVGLNDIPADMKFAQGITTTLANGSKLYSYDAGTNGLYYLQVLFNVPEALLRLPLFSLYSALVGDVGAGEMDYLALSNAQMAVSGGLSMGSNSRLSLAQVDTCKSFALLSTKALSSKPQAIDLLEQSFSQMRFDELDRITDLLQQRKARWQSRLSGSGHAYALQTAVRQMSSHAKYDYHNNGINAFLWLREVMEKLEKDQTVLTQIITDLKAIHHYMLGVPRDYILVAEASQVPALQQHLQRVWLKSAVVNSTNSLPTMQLLQAEKQVDDVDTAWLMQTNVQYCVAAYMAVPAGHQDVPALMVLGPYLKHGFLHRALREQGGAYGGGAGYDANSASFRFSSYRDPRLAETFADYDASIEWLLTQPQEAYQLEEAILGIIASMDKPGSPAGEAINGCLATLHGRTESQRRALRQALLTVSLDDLKRVAQQYVVQGKKHRAVVAPFAKEDELKAMGFKVERV